MVGEFPELQGVIGGYYARAQGQTDAVANAIRDHYKPAGQGDEVPTDPVTVAVNIADRLDTLVAFFSIGEKPTGSRDPFALRRAALGFLQILTKTGLRLPLSDVLVQAAVLNVVSRLGAISLGHLPRSARRATITSMRSPPRSAPSPTATATASSSRWKSELTPNIERGKIIEEVEGPRARRSSISSSDRLKVQQREAGVRHDLIDAVFALGGEDDLVRLLARVKALQDFVETPEGADLLAGYKRAANILKKEEWTRRTRQRTKPLSYTPQIEETELDDALDAAEPRVAAALEDEDYRAARWRRSPRCARRSTPFSTR